MADKAPGATKKRRGRPPKAKAPDPSTLPIEDAAEAAAAAAVKDGSDGAEPQSGDKPPGAEPGAAPRKPRSRVTKKGTQQIEDALRELLQMPAVPASIFGDRWAAQHFTGYVCRSGLAPLGHRARR
jgi:hypothetical protein